MSDQKSCAQNGLINPANLVHLSDEELMRLRADISDELERRYREAKRRQRARADELRRQAHNLATESALEDGLEAEAEIRKATSRITDID